MYNEDSVLRPSANNKIVLQSRDIDLFRGLYESRVLKLSHIAAIYFEGKAEMARKRVARLKQAGYIAERERDGRYSASLLTLSKAGFQLLKERERLNEYPSLTVERMMRRGNVSPLTLAHELDILDLKAAMVSAARGVTGVSIPTFSTWPALHRFDAADRNGELQTVNPDGFIRLHETEPSGEVFESMYFLEVDRSEEGQATLIAKCERYRHWYRSGGMTERHGASPDDYEDFYFRVLITCKTAERRNNLIERLLACEPPILSQVWVGVFEEVLADPLGQVWMRPKEYRDVMSDLPGNTRQPSGNGFAYRKQPERNAFVESHIEKRTLLTPST